MLKKLMITTFVLSALLLIVAAFVGPEQFEQWSSDAPVQPEAVKEESEWCIKMEDKPNKEWQEEDFQRFASECLD